LSSYMSWSHNLLYIVNQVSVKGQHIQYIWLCLQALVEQRRSPVSHWLHVGGVKAFADGSLGSGSALFHEAYADDNTNYGLHVSDPDWLLEAVLEADNAGLQVAVHAIGDAANDQVLAMFDTVKSKNGHRDRRFRVIATLQDI
jgi:predicted amidohydrolase YtcJ